MDDRREITLPVPVLWVLRALIVAIIVTFACVLAFANVDHLILEAYVSDVAASRRYLGYLFIAGTVVGVWQTIQSTLLLAGVLSGRRYLKLDRHGYTESWLHRAKHTPWAAIGPLFVRKVNGLKTIFFRRVDVGHGPLDRYRPKGGFIHGRYGMKPEALADLMNRYRDAALGAEGRSGEGSN